MTQSSLTTRLRRVRQRLLIIGCCAAIVWGICSAAAILAASIWLDLVWELSPTWRVGLLVFTTVAMLASIGVLVRFALERATGNSVARRVDQVGGTGGEILSGWQLACREKSAGDS